MQAATTETAWDAAPPRGGGNRVSGMAKQAGGSGDGRGATGAIHQAAIDGAFARARRHSTHVRILKFALPALAVAMAATFGYFSFRPASVSFDIDMQSTAVSDGKLVMANPKLEGFTRDNLPYSMSAMRAIQDLGNEDVIQLEEISARLPVKDENWADVVAEGGVFNRTANTLNLDSPVTVTTTDGTVARFRSAHLDIAKGDLTTDDPVEITMNGSSIASGSLSVLENGKVLLFDKRVRMNINPERLNLGQRADGGNDASD
jgi:lipopolysaccharide export system protein LptC